MAVFVLSGVVLVFSYWLTGRLCSPRARVLLMDHPNQRSLHNFATPRTGGLAILASFGAGLLLSRLIEWLGLNPWSAQQPLQGGVIAVTAVLMLVIGLISLGDDWIGIPTLLRLAIHAVAAAGMVYSTGLTIDVIAVPSLGEIALGWMAVPVTILFLVWMTNLYNFMDGMDGFAGGMTVVGFAFLGFLAWRAHHGTIMIVCFLVAAATAGFLYFNIPPARIFMGDVGSASLGFLAGSLVLMGLHFGVFDLWVPLIIFSPFIADATVTLFRRMLQGKKFWQAHREHYYQRLVLAGWGHGKTVVAEYVLMLACGLSTLVYGLVTDAWRLAIVLGWIAMYAVLAWNVRVMERQGRGA